MLGLVRKFKGVLKEKKKKSGFRKGRGICAFKTKAFNFIFILK